MLCKSIIEAIGHTPLVRINRILASSTVEIYAKIEASNPGGSIKERVALSMIEEGEKSGALTPDKIVLEATSGNTGIGLAMVCAAKGYRCLLIMPESASIERRRIMQAYGAEILLTPASRATDGAIEKSYALIRENPDRYFLSDQYNNPANWMTHYNATAPEIWEQTAGRVTHVVATLGTSGTVMGHARWFAEHQPHVKVIAVEPNPKHKIQGLKNMKESYTPGIYDKSLASEIVGIEDEAAFDMARRLAREEGILVGMSSGAAMSAAVDYAKGLETGFVVVLFPDGGERYLSTSLFAPQKQETDRKNALRLYNTLSRKKQVFTPIKEGKVSFYSCGPTAYERSNLQLCRRFIVTDLIQRYLARQGFEVESCMNFTDLDDNTIAGAEGAGKGLREYTAEYIDYFLADMDALGVTRAQHYPRASEYVDDMIQTAHALIHKGMAYEKHGSIYFDVAKFKRYGKLSGIDLDGIQPGKTVDLDNYEKDNPRDFTILKRSTLAELKQGIFFSTDWGNVRPSWHIECPVLVTKHLGATIDIHTSSRNLIFPHHENELAIAESVSGKPLANYWLHSEMLLVDGKSMNRDAGNVILLQEVLDRGFSAREVRFMMLMAHYRKPLNFSFKRLESARAVLRRLDDFTCKLNCLPAGKAHPEVAAYVSRMEEQFTEAMNDDLNISGAMAAIYNFIKKLNPIMQMNNLDADQKSYILQSLTGLDEVLGVFHLQGCPLRPEVNALIKKREDARTKKDYAAADQARMELAQLGIVVIDTENGPIWRKSEKTSIPMAV